MASGNPVVAYMLDGMPKQYRSFIHEIKPGDAAELKNAMESALSLEKKVDEAEPSFFAYARNNLSCDKIADRIMDLYRMCK